MKEIYDKIYREGQSNFFSVKNRESVSTIVNWRDWDNLDVLEVGCGTGDLAAQLAFYGARVVAIDPSEEAIKIAKERDSLGDRCEFKCQSYEDAVGLYDVIVMNGVLEHFDDPFQALAELKTRLNGKKRTTEIVTCSPSFLNPRGYVWMTLQLLFNVPMSLTDKHWILPSQMEKWCDGLGGFLNYTTCDQDWGNGRDMLGDFTKRLPNALRDAKMEGNVTALLNWLEEAMEDRRDSDVSGANIVYSLSFNGN